MGLSAIEKTVPRSPGKTVILPPWVFADSWSKKPKSSVCLGLRLLSESDRSRARAEAERIALDHHPNGGPNWLDAFNDALLRQAVALGTCDPNDVTRPSDLMELPEEEVAIAFTSAGARFVFEALEQYESEVSPISPEVGDEDMHELIGLLDQGALEYLSPVENRRVRRLLGAALLDLRSAMAHASS